MRNDEGPEEYRRHTDAWEAGYADAEAGRRDLTDEQPSSLVDHYASGYAEGAKDKAALDAEGP